MLSHANITRLEEVIKADAKDARYRVLKTMEKAGGMARCITKGLPQEELFLKTIDFMVCCATNILQFHPSPDWEEMIEHLSVEPADVDTLEYSVVCAGVEAGKMLEAVAHHHDHLDIEKIVNHSVGAWMPAVIILRRLNKSDAEISTAFKTSCERWAEAARS